MLSLLYFISHGRPGLDGRVVDGSRGTDHGRSWPNHIARLNTASGIQSTCEEDEPYNVLKTRDLEISMLSFWGSAGGLT